MDPEDCDPKGSATQGIDLIAQTQDHHKTDQTFSSYQNEEEEQSRSSQMNDEGELEDEEEVLAAQSCCAHEAARSGADCSGESMGDGDFDTLTPEEEVMLYEPFSNLGSASAT